MPIIVLSSFFLFNHIATFANDIQYGRGLKKITREEKRKLNERVVKKVRPNKIAIKRINEEKISKGENKLEILKNDEAEFEFGEGSADIETSSLTIDKALVGTSALVTEVDNSKLISFPGIGNQSGQNSCAAWAATYYLMSHEVCLTKGCNNLSLKEKIFSPRWTYNMINSGADTGAYFSDAFTVMRHHGAVTNAEFPYGSDYRGWSLNPEHWRSAIYNRMSPMATAAIGTDLDMENVKQILLNGHIVVMGTYINSWLYKTIGVNSNAESNLYAGQHIAYAMNGTSGGHAMAIVGYNDSVWTDINGNLQVDTGELGAFKVANSWGTSWKNAGYIWVSYDAFRITSSVPNFSIASRYPISQNSGNKVLMATYENYSPKVLAKVRTSHLKRNQINFTFGTSGLLGTTAQYTFSPYAFTNRAGAYAFDGTTSEIEGTFYFDLTPMMTNGIDQTKFYLKAIDNTLYDYLTIADYEIVDETQNMIVLASADAPKNFDGATVNLSATPRDTISPSSPTQLAVTLKTVKQGRKTVYYANLNWKASTDNVGVAKYTIYRDGGKYAETTGLTYQDSSTNAGVNYNYQVSAVDTSGNVSPLSAIVSFKR